MPVSMTGYGRKETNAEGWTHVWEVKSVNGRFLDVKWRLPHSMRANESVWEKIVRKYGSRGRVDISLNLDVHDPELLGMAFNAPQARAMVKKVQGFAAEYGDTFTPDYNKMLSMSSLWKDAGGEPDPKLLDSLKVGLEEALVAWKQSRAEEGEDMAVDLRTRFGSLAKWVDEIRVHVPAVLETRRASLRERISKHLESLNAEYSEERMLQEVAILTDKLDVSEELTRLDAHLARVDEVMEKNAECGKRLDFLIQETFREINTCGNKTQEISVSKLVVEFKAELEKCREQVQNLE